MVPRQRTDFLSDRLLFDEIAGMQDNKLRLEVRGAVMDPGTVTGICIILGVLGVVFWLPVIVFFPVIKSIADRIAGKSSQAAQITSLQQKVLMLEHEVSEIRSKQLLLEDSQKFDQQLSKQKKSNE
jgi:hypothetical protein